MQTWFTSAQQDQKDLLSRTAVRVLLFGQHVITRHGVRCTFSHRYCPPHLLHRVRHHRLLVGPALGDQVQLLLHVRTHLVTSVHEPGCVLGFARGCMGGDDRV